MMNTHLISRLDEQSNTCKNVTENIYFV